VDLIAEYNAPRAPDALNQIAGNGGAEQTPPPRIESATNRLSE
jgi:hypothetical protein